MAIKKLYRLIFFLLFISDPGLSQQPKLVLPIGHIEAINDACFSPDGKYILTASDDSTAKLWSAQTGMLLMEYKPHIGSLISATFSKDGNQMISMSADSSTKIWSVQTGLLLNNTDWNARSAWKPKYTVNDGLRRIDIIEDSIIRITENKTKKKIQEFIVHGSVIQKAIFSPDLTRVLAIASVADAASPFPACYIWNINTAELTTMLRGYSQYLRMSPAFSPDGTQIISVNQDNIITRWMDQQASMLPFIHGKTDMEYHIPFSRNGKKMITVNDESLKIIGWEKGTLVKKLRIQSTDIELLEDLLGAPVERSDTSDKNWRDQLTGFRDHDSWEFITDAMLSPDETRILTIGMRINTPGIFVKLWDAKKAIVLWKEFYGRADYFSFSKNGKYFFMLDADASLVMYNAKDGKKMAALEKNARGGAISPDNSTIVTILSNGLINIRSGIDGKLLHHFTEPIYKKYFTDPSMNDISPMVAISNDNKKIALAFLDGRIILLDGITGKIISDIKTNPNALVIKDDPNPFFYVGFSPDGKELMTSNPGGTASFWSAIDGKFIASLKGEFKIYSLPSYSPDAKKIITTAADNSINIWDAITHTLQYSFFQVDSTDYMYVLPSGYYKASGSAARKLHYVTKDLAVMTFEQLDVKYNRPDKVLEAVGCKNKVLIESYRTAFYKRLQKLGIDSSSFSETYSMPVAEIKNADSIHTEQKSENLTIEIKATDSIFKLDRFNVWINEVPLFGIKGFNIRKEGKNDLDTSITVTLSNGENKIEASVTNVNGIESYRKPLLVKYEPAEKKAGKIYFIGVGINHFADSTYDLKWCVQDIRDLTKTMRSKYGNQLVIVDTLYNENATRTNIRSLKKKLLNTNVNDKVIFSYSGHGLLSKDYDYYISSYTVNFNNPEEGGIPYDEIENMLDSIPARKKILLLDACNSGEVDKEEMKKIQAASAGLVQNNTIINAGSRGVKVVNTNDSAYSLGLQNSFELMQSLFVNVGKGTGAIIISASGGVQFAQERSELGHGVFTYSVIEAMKKYSTIKVSGLKKYIDDRVMQLTNGLQKPTTRNEPVGVDWEL